MTNHRILCFNDKAPIAPEGHASNLKVLYSSSKLPNSCKKSSRFIPSQPERILDAPEILNDYYLQLLDWNSNNMLAVALGRELYLWDAQSGSISNLLQLPESEYISSVAWVEGANNLAVGTSAAEIQLWDADKSKRLRRMVGHTARVSSLSWNSYILSSGSRNGAIFHHDVRVSQHHVGTLLGHDQEVCGLKWSTNGQYLASGSNDNTVNVWPKNVASEKPVYTFTAHQAAVKVSL
jgi:cell division cycle protein 20 homolog